MPPARLGKRLRSIGGTVAGLDMRSSRPPPKMAEGFYQSVEWTKLRALLIRQRGHRCEACWATHDGLGRPVRLIADHMTERRDGGADLDPCNIRLMCMKCHNKKTAREAARRIA
jgi:5-methylcytosine-specific restriction protein A